MVHIFLRHCVKGESVEAMWGLLMKLKFIRMPKVPASDGRGNETFKNSHVNACMVSEHSICGCCLITIQMAHGDDLKAF